MGSQTASGRPAAAIPAGSVPASSRPRDVRKAIAYIRANLHRVIPIAELAARAGVSERTLHGHFRTFIGATPGGFSMRVRLAAVRRELQEPSRCDPVTDVALRYGFAHLGRFSRHYRQAFGETPSATRRAAIAPKSGAGTDLAAPAPRGDRPEIVVMPFTAPPALSELSRLLADSIAAALTGDAAVSVAPPGMATGRRREVRARYVIRGRIVDAGEQVRVVAALVDAAGDRHLWGDAWDGVIANPFPAIDRVVAGVAHAVLPNIRQAEIARVCRRRPRVLEAWELCLRAYPLLEASTPGTARQALDLHRAIERDPDYALPAGLAAWGHTQLVVQIGSASPAADAEQARLLSARGGILDPDDPVVLTARCVVHTVAEEHDAACALIEGALARSPEARLGPWAWERSGWLRLYSGAARASIACFGRSLRLDTSNAAKVMRFCGIAAGFFDAGRYDLATRWMQRALNAEPGAKWINRTLAVLLGPHRRGAPGEPLFRSATLLSAGYHGWGCDVSDRVLSPRLFVSDSQRPQRSWSPRLTDRRKCGPVRAA